MAPAMMGAGTLPAVSDPAQPGTFTPMWEGNVGPSSDYTTITPMPFGKDGIKHPILIWGPGAGAYPEIYKTASFLLGADTLSASFPCEIFRPD